MVSSEIILIYDLSLKKTIIIIIIINNNDFENSLRWLNIFVEAGDTFSSGCSWIKSSK